MEEKKLIEISEYDLLFKHPIYNPISLNFDLEEVEEREVIYDEDIENDEYNPPTILNHTTFKESKDFKRLKKLITEEHSFAGYCPICKKLVPLKLEKQDIEYNEKNDVVTVETNIDSREIYESCLQYAENKLEERLNLLIENKLITFKVYCNKKHSLISIFNLDKEKNKLIKIGQYPSLNDFDTTLNKYSSILKDENRKDINKALGLESHGIGAGSFVYLRRVFEKLIFDVFDENAIEINMTKADFIKLKMENKIEKLESFLPNFLTENKKVLYGILSKGVHELTEKECLNYFDTMLKSIIIILEEKNKLKNKKEVKDKLQKIYSDLKLKEE